MNDGNAEGGKKAAFAALAGRPSAGKSTLVNLLCGQPVAIVSSVPQTTRNAIRGIINRKEGQLVLVDTPGLHLSRREFNRRLAKTALRAAGEADIILYVLDASRAPGPEEEAAALELAACAGSGSPEIPLVAAVNKMDHPQADFERTAAFLKGHFPSLDKSRILPVSALKNEGTERLLAALYSAAPRGEPFYGEEYYTDQEIDFRISEIIRGEAIIRLRQELPHALYVEVADMEWRRTGGKKPSGQEPEAVDQRSAGEGGPGCRRLWVRAFIVCERESQKGIIVGRGGRGIKAIGEAARKKMNRIFDWKVELDLRVKAGGDWRKNEGTLRKTLAF
ncbi:MAG: GTPase Era [Treponema sp.]|nr:GTPase Era [Treponema sp.]